MVKYWETISNNDPKQHATILHAAIRQTVTNKTI
jgi:hypothetical protein